MIWVALGAVLFLSVLAFVTYLLKRTVEFDNIELENDNEW